MRAEASGPQAMQDLTGPDSNLDFILIGVEGSKQRNEASWLWRVGGGRA